MSDSVGRILLFGATGYTGRITARIMVEAGAAPVLVGRSESAVAEMVDELSPLAPVGRAPTWEIADAKQPSTLRNLVTSSEDVLVSTVGPFQRLGGAAVEAVIQAGAAYVDSSGEPAFIRAMFEKHGRHAERTGARLLPAMGYDFAPGNLAGGLLIERSDPPPEQIDIGYFVRGPYTPSSGTMGTLAGIMLDPSHALRNSEIVNQRPAAHVRSFRVGGKPRDGVSLGGTEQFALRDLDPMLRNVGVYVGWTGRWSKAASAAGVMTANTAQLPVVGSAFETVIRATVGGVSDTGPKAHQRIRATSYVVAESRGQRDQPARRVQVEGPNPYDLTGELLTWSAQMLSHRRELRTGAMGPITAFGMDAFVSGCLAMGLAETNPADA